MKTRDQVIAEVARLTAVSHPALEESDVAACVDACLRATPWAVSTNLIPGQLVVPPITSWNGRQYRVSEGGTTSATASEMPSWPTERASYIGKVLTDSTSGIALIDSGPAHTELYDIGGAIGEAWLLKAGKATELHGFSTQGHRTDANQIFEHCCKMARAYGRTYVR